MYGTHCFLILPGSFFSVWVAGLAPFDFVGEGVVEGDGEGLGAGAVLNCDFPPMFSQFPFLSSSVKIPSAAP